MNSCYQLIKSLTKIHLFQVSFLCFLVNVSSAVSGELNPPTAGPVLRLRMGLERRKRMKLVLETRRMRKKL